MGDWMYENLTGLACRSFSEERWERRELCKRKNRADTTLVCARRSGHVNDISSGQAQPTTLPTYVGICQNIILAYEKINGKTKFIAKQCQPVLKRPQAIPPVPFCQITLKAQKPPDPVYPKLTEGLGGHIRKRHLEEKMTAQGPGPHLGCGPWGASTLGAE